jgi:hypothetical protein
MKNAMIIMGALMMLLVTLKCVELGYMQVQINELKVENALTRQIVVRSNRNTARMYQRLKPKPSPCDMVGFEILEDKCSNETIE